MDFDRIYAYRFRGIDPIARDRVWKIVATYIHYRMGYPECVLDPAAGGCQFINAVPSHERWAVDQIGSVTQFADPNVKTIVGDILTIDLPSHHFDAIFLSNFLEHLASPQQVFECLKRLKSSLKDDGIIAVMGPNFRYTSGKYFDCADHVLPLTEISVAEHLYGAGFEPTEIIPRFLPYSFRNAHPALFPLVSLYLKIPFFWRFFGEQFLVFARKDQSLF